MPTPHPRYNEDDVEQTINEESPVDEASFESFPASDPPAFTRQTATPAAQEEKADEDDDR